MGRNILKEMKQFERAMKKCELIGNKINEIEQLNKEISNPKNVNSDELKEKSEILKYDTLKSLAKFTSGLN